MVAENRLRGFDYDCSKPINPLALIKKLWPHYRLTMEQQEMVLSAWYNRETIVPAANAMGKDFVTGLIAVIFFLTRSPCRIVVTSVNGPHLAVIWGEIRRHIDTCAVPLDWKKGGCLMVNSEQIRKMRPDNTACPISYIKNLVCSDETSASLQGHHATAWTHEEALLNVPLTMAITDESSGIDSLKIEMLTTWAHRLIMIGNCWPCDNYFRYAVEGSPDGKDKGGDIPRSNGDGYERRIIQIPASTSPNVKFAEAQLRLGMSESDPRFAPPIVQGIRKYQDYKFKRSILDEVRQCAELDAIWYKGSHLLLFPPTWLANSATLAHALQGTQRTRRAKAIGVDCAEGGDNFSMCAGDELGVIEQLSFKTPDTSVIPGHVIAFGKKHNVSPQNWLFDRGGGGKQWSDELRRRNYMVRTIGFGEMPSSKAPKRGEKSLKDRVEQYEDKSVYKNRRAEMYGEASIACNPTHRQGGYGIPATEEFKELRRQLAAIPKLYDGDGVLYMLSKDKKKEGTKEKTLKEILGCSPDEADAFVLMYHGVQSRVTTANASTPVPTSYDGYQYR